MHALSIIADCPDAIGPVGSQLGRMFETQLFSRASFPAAPSGQYAFVDIDLANHAGFPELNQWINRLPKNRVVVFAVDDGARRQTMQAGALGATTFITRPVTGKALLEKLMGDVGALVGETADLELDQSHGVAAGIDALQSIFAAVGLGKPIDSVRLDRASEAVVSQLQSGGLAQWVDIVRMHHSQTYQHCLLVTGIATAFACHLGFSRADRNKLALAGLLHDVGKASIPIAILEKPGPLDEGELAVMRQHPEFGFAALKSAAGLEADVLDMVLHHHEYLDGSGYPHGLRGSEVSDLARLMTISDIFGALLERRSYKDPLSGPAAYKVLQKMGAKLDPDVTRAFAPIAHMHD
jgi:putative nucleotidyltransferase with HDIG domain